MNRNCGGHRFKINGVNLYRCLYNGIVMKTGRYSECPACDRPISAEQLGAVDHKAVRATVTDSDFSARMEAHMIRHDNLFNGEWTQIVLPVPWES